MIYYAMIVRSRDGLVLSATMETDNIRIVKETKRHLKFLAKKLMHFPDRCSLLLNSQVIHFVTSLGVSFIALCQANYPNVLAFSFLDDLMKEFIVAYSTSSINSAKRPYSFIEFDRFIHKFQQRYNNPRSLTTKVNLSDLSLEIKLRPPKQLYLHDIQPPVNETFMEGVNMLVSPSPRLMPISWLGVTSITVNGFCILYNVVQGMLCFSETKAYDKHEETNPIYGLIHLLEATFQCFQIYLLLEYPRHRLIKTYLCFLMICLCNLYVWFLRDLAQILLHVAISSFITFAIITRKLEQKAPNYNV